MRRNNKSGLMSVFASCHLCVLETTDKVVLILAPFACNVASSSSSGRM
jgi:hypothetical protein